MKRLALGAALLAATLVAPPASAQMIRCEEVFQYDGWEVQAEGLEPYGEYYLYVRNGGRDGTHGWDAYALALANGGGFIRILLEDDDEPFDGYQIRDANGDLVAHC